MKGLLIKDFRLLKGQVHFLLIVTVCVIVFMINGNEAFGVAYVCSMVALLSLTTVSYDEYENGFCIFIYLTDYKERLCKRKISLCWNFASDRFDSIHDHVVHYSCDKNREYCVG